MNTIDLTPLYRNSIGFDRLGSLVESAFRGDTSPSHYPPYNIEVVEENKYSITLAVAGFTRDELSIEVEQGVLTVKGTKPQKKEQPKYLHQGIAARDFEHQFNLAEFVEVSGASLNDGLLTISMVKEVPEAMKPRKIEIGNNDSNVIEHKPDKDKAA